MARKRKSSEMSLPSANQASNGQQLQRDLDDFCRRAKFDLNYTEYRSHDNYDRTDVKQKAFRCYELLWWKDRPALRRVEEAFLSSVSTFLSESQRVELFCGLVEAPAREAATPQPKRFREAENQPEALEDVAEDPPSPSPANRGIGGYFGATKSRASRKNAYTAPEAVKQPTSEPEVIGQPTIRSYFAPMRDVPQGGPLLKALEAVKPMDPPPVPWATKPTPPSSQTRGTRSANTSFATTNANTSFATTNANTSFWSNPGGGSQETTASSFSGSQVRGTESSQSSKESESTEKTAWSRVQVHDDHTAHQEQQLLPDEHPHQLPDFRDDLAYSRESQSTFYGSSLDPREVEALLSKGQTADEPMPDALLPNAGTILQATRGLTFNNIDGRRAEPSDLINESAGIIYRPDDLAPSIKHQYSNASQKFHQNETSALQLSTAHPPRPQPSTQQPAVLPILKPKRPFAKMQSPAFFSTLPFVVRWEAQRVFQSGVMSVEELHDRWKLPRSLQTLYDLLSEYEVDFRRGFDDASLPMSLENITMGSKLEWNDSKDGAFFNIILGKPKKEVSSALQRKVGADEVLYMEIPSLQKSSSHKAKDELASFRQFCSQPQEFLGRRWFLYFLQPSKKKGERNSHRAIWVTRIEALQWALPIYENANQKACKAYMRLELQLSRTIPIAKLRPYEIARVEDLKATCDPDDRTFERPNAQFFETYDSSKVMNDGCNQASFWLMSQFAHLKGLTSIPSALQFRAAGAKGVAYLEDEDPRKLRERPNGPLLWISDSQAKVFQDLSTADEEWLSVNVVKQNGAPRTSFLYVAFLPILINGGVPPEAITREVRDQVRMQTKEFLQALDAADTLPLRRWMQSTNSTREMKNRDTGIRSIGGFPVSREERVIKMLECGFMPKKCNWLAHEVKQLAKSAFDLRSQHFQIRLAQSTTLMGIADPEGCLAPGEVHIRFENAFLDTVTGRSVMELDGMEVLVARNPALGAWDIQKVKCVYHHKLARFKNLVVFPSKGMRPLAEKLQGGDYDGDTFWICWSKRLTENFQNTPAPWDAPSPESCGITVDKTPLSDLIQDPHSEEQWCRFLGKMHEIRMQNSASAMLGIVTLELEKLNYAQGTIDSPEARALIPVHDYMADADKQGYRYNPKAFRAFMKDKKIPANSPDPRYWEFTRHDPKATSKEKKEKERSHYPANQARVESNITDKVFFDVVEPLVNEALEEASKTLKDVGTYDDDLVSFYKQTEESAPEGSHIRRELTALKNKMSSFRDYWRNIDKKVGGYQVWVQALRTEFTTIMPDNQDDPVVVEWMRRQGHGFTTWDLLRASALAKFQHFGTEKAGQLLFLAAGRELCYLKLMEVDPNAQFMLADYYAAHKVRPAPKVDRPVDEYDSADEEDEDVFEGGYY